jgi:GNAT superfamily N-acetyltransferase
MVRHDQRGRGIATSLLRAAERLAKRFGFSRLYVSTTALGEPLLRTGWHRYGVVEFLNDEIGSIYARDL